jgi:hypothetical protein
MFCPHCGAESTNGLKFCKRCGGNLLATQATEIMTIPNRAAGSAWAIALASVAICLGGLGIVFSHAFDLMRPVSIGMQVSGDRDMIAGIMIILGSLTVLGVVALLVRLFTRLMLGSKEIVEPTRSMNATHTGYVPAGLNEPPANFPTVTEHTTRNFEPRHIERQGR